MMIIDACSNVACWQTITIVKLLKATYIWKGDLSTEGLVTGAERLIKVKSRSLCHLLPYNLDLLFDLDEQLPRFAVVTHGLLVEGRAAGGCAILQPLAAQLASVVLINWHESGRKFTVLEKTIDLPVAAVEKERAIVLRGFYVKLGQSCVKFYGVQIALAIFIKDAKGVD